MTRFLFLALIITLFSCKGNKTEKLHEENQPRVQKSAGITEFGFNEEMHNFGTLQAGEIVVCTFTVTNKGNNDLTIKDVITDCGCLQVNYPKEPISPGKTGLIEVEFDSSGLFGRQFKSIEVHANTKKPKQLAIFAEVQNDELEIKY